MSVLMYPRVDLFPFRTSFPFFSYFDLLLKTCCRNESQFISQIWSKDGCQEQMQPAPEMEMHYASRCGGNCCCAVLLACCWWIARKNHRITSLMFDMKFSVWLDTSFIFIYSSYYSWSEWLPVFVYLNHAEKLVGISWNPLVNGTCKRNVTWSTDFTAFEQLQRPPVQIENLKSCFAVPKLSF